METPGMHLVSEETRWECQRCGNCCTVPEWGRENMKMLLGHELQPNGRCFYLNEKNMCRNYSERPLICRMHPFHPDKESLKIGKPDFSAGKLLISKSCKGLGCGEKVFRNRQLMKKLGRIAEELSAKIKTMKSGTLQELFYTR